MLYIVHNEHTVQCTSLKKKKTVYYYSKSLKDNIQEAHLTQVL